MATNRETPPCPEEIRAETYRSDFINDFEVIEREWGPRNIKKLVYDGFLYSKRPAVKSAEVRRLLEVSGLRDFGHPSRDGVWDHGELWVRNHRPWCLVGHPYDIQAHERAALVALAKYPQFKISIDDRPSHYGFGTHHVRLQLSHPYRMPGGTMVLDDSLLVPLDG